MKLVEYSDMMRGPVRVFGSRIAGRRQVRKFRRKMRKRMTLVRESVLDGLVQAIHRLKRKTQLFQMIYILLVLKTS